MRGCCGGRTPGTGWPLLVSRVSVTGPPVPPSADGETSRTRSPPAVIGIATDALLPISKPGAVKVSVGVPEEPLPPLELAMPFV